MGLAVPQVTRSSAAARKGLELPDDVYTLEQAVSAPAGC